MIYIVRSNRLVFMLIPCNQNGMAAINFVFMGFLSPRNVVQSSVFAELIECGTSVELSNKMRKIDSFKIGK